MLKFSRNREARLHYLANDYRVLASGDHVVCAMTGERIPLESLRYWSVALQQPYASAQASLDAARKAGGVG